MIYTTLNRIRACRPCGPGWEILRAYLGKTRADNEPLAYATILDSNGMADALWAMRSEPQHARIWRMYAVRRARSVQHLLTDPRSHAAIDVAEQHARGLATDEELKLAYAAASAIAYAAHAYAAHAHAAAYAYAADETDFRALLAEHEAAPGGSCEMVEWWVGQETAK